MEWTSEQVHDEIRRRVHEATEQLQKELRVREVRMRMQNGDWLVLPIINVLHTDDGSIVHVDRG